MSSGLRAGVTVAALAALACGDAAPPAPATAPEPTSSPVLPSVVARVNDVEISRAEFERAVRAQEIRAGQVVPPQFRDQIYSSVLDRLVAFHLLMQESEARDVAVAPEDVDAELGRIRDRFESEEAFDAQLATWRTTREALREEARKDLLIARMIALETEPRLTIDEAGVRAFYDQHQAQFTERGAVQAHHILVAVEPGAPRQAVDAARARLEALRAELDAGAGFEDLARTHSEDPGTAPTGGDLGFVEPGQMVPGFEEALFALEPGAVSPVVQTRFGFHLIQAGTRRPDRVMPFEAARDLIEPMLLERERESLATAFIDELEARSDIERYL